MNIRYGWINSILKDLEKNELYSDLLGIITISSISTYLIIKNYIKNKGE